jgi:5-methylcytosine-specific restriction endonuclease McrA
MAGKVPAPRYAFESPRKSNIMDENEILQCRATELICTATDANSEFMERISDASAISMDLLKKILNDAKVPVHGIILSDIQRILEGEHLRYFVSEDTLVERYRERNGFELAEENEEGADNEAVGLRKIDPQVAVDFLNLSRSERARTGVTFDEYRDGVACYNEQNVFYGSEEWQDRSKVVQLIDGWRCSVCKKRGVKLHTHHHGPIYTVFSRKFRRNFEVNRLKIFCEDCHNRFHETHVRSFGDFELADADAKRRESVYFQNLKRAHDEQHSCRFCFGDVHPG